MDALRIFVIEDDAYYAEYVKYAVRLTGDHDVVVFDHAADMITNLKQKPDLITLDFNLPDGKGDRLLKRIKSLSPDTEVIIVSSQEDVETAITLMREGAFDYIVKNSDAKNRIVHSIHNYIKERDLKEKIQHLESAVEYKYKLENLIVSKDQSMSEVYKLILKAASSKINISITGETGTGKELVARAVHYNSERKANPFVAINLAAIPETLIESELFGHVKGSFTGAISDRAGVLEEAKNGTIFLDEIAEIPLHIQVKLLRVLQEREFARIGGNKMVKLEGRIICATNKDLLEEVQKGNFREDLYYRLVGLPIKLPRLIDRGNDMLYLANHFMISYSRENNLEVSRLTEDAMDKIRAHHWPGNVRELKATIELACVMAEEGVISRENLMISHSLNVLDSINTNMTLKEITYRIIVNLLDKNNQNVRKVAKMLDIGKSTIYRILKEKDSDTDYDLNKAS